MSRNEMEAAFIRWLSNLKQLSRAFAYGGCTRSGGGSCFCAHVKLSAEVLKGGIVAFYRRLGC